MENTSTLNITTLFSLPGSIVILLSLLFYWDKQYEVESSLFSFIATISYSLNLFVIFITLPFLMDSSIFGIKFNKTLKIIMVISLSIASISSTISVGLHCNSTFGENCFKMETVLYLYVLVYFFPFIIGFCIFTIFIIIILFYSIIVQICRRVGLKKCDKFKLIWE